MGNDAKDGLLFVRDYLLALNSSDDDTSRETWRKAIDAVDAARVALARPAMLSAAPVPPCSGVASAPITEARIREIAEKQSCKPEEFRDSSDIGYILATAIRILTAAGVTVTDGEGK